MTYYINPCGPITSDVSKDCSGSAVCQVNKNKQGSSFGNAAIETFVMEGKTIKVGYTDGVSCTGSSKLRFSSRAKKNEHRKKLQRKQELP